ncbi:MAG: tRNA-dihydrouridine synthase family protein [Lentisphaeria bacterium]|nr:tRNA-dihydrouridine synthase family protein [Lentisphaeria bacterium]
MTRGHKAVTIYPENAVIMAPLSGYTDLPFRRSLRRHGCVYAFTPLVEAGSIVYDNPRAPSIVARGDDEKWLGIQLLGSDLARIKTAVRKISHLRFDVLDFNMGCPVRKVTRRGAGAALGHTPEFAAECVQAIADLSPFPVTGKIRVLDHEDPAPTVRFARLLESAGCQALTIHGRLWRKVYSGPVAVDVINAVREAVTIPVIANGGVTDALSAAALRRATGCSRIMLARGAIGNPWLFDTINGGKPPGHEELCAELVNHIRDMVAFHGEENGIKVGRKIIVAYLAGRGYSRDLRGEVTGLHSWAMFSAWMARVRATGPSVGFQRRS